MLKLIRYVVGVLFIFLFVMGMFQGILLVFPNSPFYEFIQGGMQFPGAPSEFTMQFRNITTSFMHFGQLIGVMAILISVLFLAIGLIVLFAPFKK